MILLPRLLNKPFVEIIALILTVYSITMQMPLNHEGHFWLEVKEFSNPSIALSA